TGVRPRPWPTETVRGVGTPGRRRFLVLCRVVRGRVRRTKFDTSAPAGPGGLSPLPQRAETGTVPASAQDVAVSAAPRRPGRGSGPRPTPGARRARDRRA